jgi:hypothetical protein
VSHADALALFHRLVTAPENVTRTLDALGISRAEVEGTFAGDAALDAVGRLDIYADMYFFRIRDVMREQFERVAAALGEAGFHDLVTGYLVACPPRTPSLRDVGDRLGDFLAGHAASVERPWIPDLARLEWAALDVFDDADAEPLEIEELRRTPPEAFGDLALRPVPAHRLVATAFDVTGEPAAGPALLLVWRQGLHVRHRALEPLEAAALERVRAGCTFAEVCDLVGQHVSEERTAQVAFELLARWVADGVLARAPIPG